MKVIIEEYVPPILREAGVSIPQAELSIDRLGELTSKVILRDSEGKLIGSITVLRSDLKQLLVLL